MVGKRPTCGVSEWITSFCATAGAESAARLSVVSEWMVVNVVGERG